MHLPASAERRLLASNHAYSRVVHITELWYTHSSGYETIGVRASIRSKHGGMYHSSFLLRKGIKDSDWSSSDVYLFTSVTIPLIRHLVGLPWDEVSKHVTPASVIEQDSQRALKAVRELEEGETIKGQQRGQSCE